MPAISGRIRLHTSHHLSFSFYHSHLCVYIFCLPALQFPGCLSHRCGGGHFPGLGAPPSSHLTNWLPVFTPDLGFLLGSCPTRQPHGLSLQPPGFLSHLLSLPFPGPCLGPALSSSSLDPCPSLQCHPSVMHLSCLKQVQQCPGAKSNLLGEPVCSGTCLPPFLCSPPHAM